MSNLTDAQIKQRAKEVLMSLDGVYMIDAQAILMLASMAIGRSPLDSLNADIESSFNDLNLEEPTDDAVCGENDIT